ncbi:MAG: AMP-binding protein [Bacteroidetes bacterium]|uniref:AMP-binding protein n=1 Tax=Candidatus Cryptobacteroides excrementipullorum TaxID=2840761 RepID=A0A9D9IUY1_9BACT|nr:AMP-binding protein [Candidatus Cryptobacteroides excrementipullorum]
MNFVVKKILKLREKYIDTLAKLYEYSTAIYEHNRLSQMLDSDMGYTYGSFKRKCDELSHLLSRYGIGAGDKVAILSQNMPNWTVAMFSLVPFGRISIPILPDSSENEVTNILNHSGSKAIFISRRLMPKLSKECMDKMVLVIDIETFETIKRNDDAFTCDGKTSQPLPDDLATIIYTSGTTGNAKGVMLSHRNLCSNIVASLHAHKCTEKDVWLSILPMAHTYELSIGVLYPIFCGACVYYIQKPPTPTVLLSAMKTVRPTVMLSVPLIIEKIYRNSVIPTIRRSRVLTWMRAHTPALLYRLIGMKLKGTFGGRLKFFGIGGSKLDTKVEEFLKKARFPYAIGYGLTETAPLICNAGVKYTKPGSTGVAAYGVTVKLIDVNPDTGEGEIVCKGNNVMLGYYKDPARTRSVFTDDGWFRTNDLATVDEKGRYYIKGRLNNMILGPSGENIYPEEIENVINNMDEVNESIVVERDGRLVALVQFNDNIINWNQEGEDQFFEKLEARKKAIMSYVNKHVNKFSKINDVEVMKEPFEKTATQKIRRFKYKKAKDESQDRQDVPEQDKESGNGSAS